MAEHATFHLADPAWPRAPFGLAWRPAQLLRDGAVFSVRWIRPFDIADLEALVMAREVADPLARVRLDPEEYLVVPLASDLTEWLARVDHATKRWLESQSLELTERRRLEPLVRLCRTAREAGREVGVLFSPALLTPRPDPTRASVS